MIKPPDQWRVLDDLPEDVRTALAGSINALSFEQEERLKAVYAKAAEEAYLKATWRERLVWACRALRIAKPSMAMCHIYLAVSVAFNTSVATVRRAWEGKPFKTPAEDKELSA